jgi:hypothetical protein
MTKKPFSSSPVLVYRDKLDLFANGKMSINTPTTASVKEQEKSMSRLICCLTSGSCGGGLCCLGPQVTVWLHLRLS